MSTIKEANSRHWVTDLIGKPWVAGTYGPDTFDCWGLVWWIYKNRYGIELPLYPFDHSNTSLVTGTIVRALKEHEWNVVMSPKEGDMVLMGSTKRLHHVGIWVDPGVILHATRPTVAAQTVLQVSVRGMSNVLFYTYKNGHNC